MNRTKLFGLFLLLLIWAGCKKDDDDKNEVKAAFEWQLTDEPGKVNFTNRSSNAVTYEWNFDDGTASTQLNPVKTYNQNGEYIVTLKAFGTGATESVADTVIVDNIITFN